MSSATQFPPVIWKMRNGADPLLVSVLRAGVSHGYKRSETSPVALPHTISPSASYEWPEFLS